LPTGGNWNEKNIAAIASLGDSRHSLQNVSNSHAKPGTRKRASGGGNKSA
jgi:hypothetical protein